MASATIKFNVDSSPIRSFAESFERVLKAGKAGKAGLNLFDLPKELLRVEYDVDPANALELGITLYPSDAFLGFASACAGDFDFLGVEQT